MRLPQCQIVCGFLCLLLCIAHSAEVRSQEKAAPAIPPIKRVLPPEGIAIPADVEMRLREELATAYAKYEPLKQHELAPDIEVFLKAVRYALDLREFYTDKDFAKAEALLREANSRSTQLAAGKHPWTTATGLVVRGYRSNIDDSAQPYGMVIPKDFDFKKSLPLYTWLHGRGDKATDLHFITERMSKPGEITPPNAIVVHPFGRQCVGYLNAGEVDVIDVTMQAEKKYNTDPTKRVLIGFSMGGAGAWHVGAHYAHLFRVIAPGAGFAETAKYQKLKPEDYPPWYEQKLWGQNDTPPYVRNLFNTTVIAYSGELDRQIQAARVMEEAYQAEGQTLAHLIGPKTEHKYEPKTKEALLKKINEALQATTDEPPKTVSFQTRTLRYPTKNWVKVIRLEEHWQDSRVDAVLDESTFKVTTKNIAFFSIVLSRAMPPGEGMVKFTIDGQEFEHQRRRIGEHEVSPFLKVNGRWKLQSIGEFADLTRTPVKQAGSMGPIDDAFYSRFLVVTPSGRSKNPLFQAWQEFELAHFRARWKALMRGDFLEKKDTEVTDAELRDVNLILWGDEDSNVVIKKTAASIPIKRSRSEWIIGEHKYDATNHVPVMIFPGPANNFKYIVLNSGLTFREAHDRTNSLQNPKLPDWAMIDITQPPDANAPGKVVNAGFFDEEWQLKPPPE
jgi:predicted esterase